MRRSGKLAFVNIFMAILTLRLRDFKKGVFTLRTLWYVTFVASHQNMLAFERIFCCGMIFDRESRRRN